MQDYPSRDTLLDIEWLYAQLLQGSLHDTPASSEDPQVATGKYVEALPGDAPPVVDKGLKSVVHGKAKSRAKQKITYRSLLQNQNFRLLWISAAISTFGSYFTRIAIPLFVFSLTGSYSQLGFAFFSSLIASLVFGLFAGALVDRLDRRRTMVYVDWASALVLLVLMVSVLVPLPLVVKLGCLYLGNFVAALLREMFNPARLAIFTDVLSEDELLVANSLDGATVTFAEFVSYPVAAAVLFYGGAAAAFAVDAVTFIISAVLLSYVRAQSSVLHQADATSIWTEINEGLTIARRLSRVRKVVVLSLIVPLFFSLHNTLLIPFVEEALGSSKEVGYPALVAAEALGLLVGMLMLGRWGQSVPRSSLLAYGIVGYGLATALQGMAPYFARYSSVMTTLIGTWTPLVGMAMFFALLYGGANSFILASLRTIIQEDTPRAALGRVFSVMTVAAGAGFAGGSLLAGIGQGRSATTIAGLGSMILIVGLYSRWWLAETDVGAVRVDPHRKAGLLSVTND